MKLNEVDNPSAAFVFGRFNPPTIGHYKLYKKLKSVSPVHFVFVSHTQDAKKNPLTWKQKVSMMSAQFPDMADHVIGDPNIKTIIDVMKFLETAGHKDVAMVVGSDRVKAFKELLAKYNGDQYNFDSIDVVSAGERDPDADSLEGVSASKAREAAVQGDFEGFATMFAGSDALKKQIYDAVRKGMNVREGIKKYINDIEQEAAGVGIITKQNTTKDVNKNTLSKIMKALHLK